MQEVGRWNVLTWLTLSTLRRGRTCRTSCSTRTRRRSCATRRFCCRCTRCLASTVECCRRCSAATSNSPAESCRSSARRCLRRPTQFGTGTSWRLCALRCNMFSTVKFQSDCHPSFGVENDSRNDCTFLSWWWWCRGLGLVITFLDLYVLLQT